MYESFFGFQRKAFSLTSDPTFLFLNDRSREALAGIVYAISARKGLMVLTGDAGTGKSTLLARVFRCLPAKVHICSVVNPTLTGPEFLEMVLLNFGIVGASASKTQRLQLLRELLGRNHKQGDISVLVVDEAHKLSAEVIEEIRLLGNLESSDEKLLQVLLAGQPELADLLNRDDMRQFKQRIAVRLRIEPLPETDVEPYIEYRCHESGRPEPHPFTTDALVLIAKYSNGIPRLINSICDNALLLAFAEEARQVTGQHVRSVAMDLELVPSVPGATPLPRSMETLARPMDHLGDVAPQSIPASPEIPAFREIPTFCDTKNNSNGSGRKSWTAWWSNRRRAANI